jgi:pimeloyl-ACP methyl ester carboxylesterase
MATFVLVHGAFTGGWYWRETAHALRQHGHEVLTPTLTGLGERVHLAHPEITLDTHIQDIVNVLRFEDLHQIHLVGKSYAGMIITGVADHVPERLVQLIYLDGPVPADGQSLADFLGPETTAFFVDRAQQQGDGWRVPHPAPDDARLTPLPLKAGLQPLHLHHPPLSTITRTYIACTEGKSLEELQVLAQFGQDPQWRYRELATGHEPEQTMPLELAALLDSLAVR